MPPPASPDPAPVPDADGEPIGGGNDNVSLPASPELAGPSNPIPTPAEGGIAPQTPPAGPVGRQPYPDNLQQPPRYLTPERIPVALVVVGVAIAFLLALYAAALATLDTSAPLARAVMVLGVALSVACAMLWIADVTHTVTMKDSGRLLVSGSLISALFAAVVALVQPGNTGASWLDGWFYQYKTGQDFRRQNLMWKLTFVEKLDNPPRALIKIACEYKVQPISPLKTRFPIVASFDASPLEAQQRVEGQLEIVPEGEDARVQENFLFVRAADKPAFSYNRTETLQTDRWTTVRWTTNNAPFLVDLPYVDFWSAHNACEGFAIQITGMPEGLSASARLYAPLKIGELNPAVTNGEHAFRSDATFLSAHGIFLRVAESKPAVMPP